MQERRQLISQKMGYGERHSIFCTVRRSLLFPKMCHAKVALGDSKIAVIGSTNLTPRSMRTSREVVLFVHGSEDDPFIKKLRDRLVADMAKSKPVLEPFQIRFTDRVKALVGKYVW
jgi:phosphatidylserine/phosphatidylglycerophosphate/cardiolipin synthase-like enzyme